MGSILDKSSVLDRIKQCYNLKGNAGLARFFGVAPNTITNWYGRNTFDLDVIYTKCVGVDFNWLFTGHGSMLRSDANNKRNELPAVGCTPSNTPISPNDESFVYKMYKEEKEEKEKLNAKMIQMAEEIGNLKAKLSQYEPEAEASNEKAKGLGHAKTVSTEKPSSLNADNATSAAAQ